MPLVIRCHSCGFVFFQGEELHSLDVVLRQWGYKCPICMSPVGNHVWTRVGDTVSDLGEFHVKEIAEKEREAETKIEPRREEGGDEDRDPIDYKELARKYVESVLFRETQGKQVNSYRRLIFIRYKDIRRWVRENVRLRVRPNYTALYGWIRSILNGLGYEEVARYGGKNSRELVFRRRD